jgi:hypothetical protein
VPGAVTRRPVLSKARDRRVDDRRIARLDGVEVDAEPRRGSGPEALEDDVRAGSEQEKELPAAPVTRSTSTTSAPRSRRIATQ